MSLHASSRTASFTACAALLSFAAPLSAQVSAQVSTQVPAQASTPTLAPVTVTGNPLGSSTAVAPADQLSGTGLVLRSQSTLGETLSGTPGVSSTYFGPNASRPVIRGQDGDRIRILANSGASIDASGVSYDHAVALDPIAVERIEVLRGPGALLYGGSAVGGVVNVIDNRIPREAVTGITGRADIGLSTASRERGGAALVETGSDRYALHVDMFDRRTSDVAVPALLACTKPGSPSLARRICNSASYVRGGAVGGSLLFANGYIGASATTYRNDYGTVAEDEVTIGMKSNRYALEGEWRNPVALVKSVKAQFSRSDYSHTEFEGATPGTQFRNSGGDYRVEVKHAKLGPLEGVVGLQGERTRFAADGTEAFAPYSRTRSDALFVYEEWAAGWGKSTFGARAESVRVESLGNPLVARFVPAARSFAPLSAAAGLAVNVAPQWQATANLAFSERAPKDYELFADGPHVATGAYEVGNAALGKERSVNLDVGVQWKRDHDTFHLSAFESRFANFVSLQASGTRVVGADTLPEFTYTPVRARFRGFEASGNVRLLQSPATLDLELRADSVRAINLDTNEPLPRIAPWRAGATLAWARGDWGVRVGFDHFATQSRVPTGDLPTSAYTLWTTSVTWKMQRDNWNALWYARIDNAANTLAYSATSILTQTAPGKSPLPGRNLKVGVQLNF
ncbi:TonB-dependent receptor [Caenimonas koreensis]|uniref:TonB-dependent receptor n=1 Tax=Caenimonas koreensis TaxID=367474 RepID=UPI002B271C6A|nr:TonB-dependent receptor [Caenimonas koreensis]